MKKFIFIFLATLFECYVVKAQVVKDNLAENQYAIDFVFTGKVNPGLDSIFALRYKFIKLKFSRFEKLSIEDSYQKRIVNLRNTQATDTIEIQHDDIYSYVIIRKYNKEDIPVLTQLEDKDGQKQDLFIRNKDGNILNPKQFKQMEQMNNARIRQFKPAR